MGYNMGIYLGVYLQAHEGKTKRRRNGFINSNGKEVKTPFDPQTGEKHKEHEFIEIVDCNINHYIEDRDDLVEDMFWSPEFDGAPKNYRNLMVNEHDPIIHPRTFDPENGGCMDLSDLKIDEAIAKFKDKYKDYLDYFYNKYGEENFEIKYGLIAYWS